MEEAFHRDFFSFPYNISRYLGNWPWKVDNPAKNKFLKFYRAIAIIYEWQLVIIGWVDLYLNLNNFNRMVYNMCVTFFTTTITVKNLYFIWKAERVEKLRQNLFNYSLTCDEKGIEILDRHRYFLKIFKYVFYTFLAVLAPIWWLSSLISLKWGPRELPFPLWLPLDVEDDIQFVIGFIYHALAAIIFVTRAIHAELAMFSLILQITGHYRILAKDVLKINDFYIDRPRRVESGRVRRREINKFLTRIKVKKELGKLIKRQLELKECVKDAEYILHVPMLFQLFGGLLLSVLNGFELIEVTMGFNFKLSYQMAYTGIVLTDLFACCLLSNRLIDASRSVYAEIYNLMWYKMEIDIRKTVLLMMIGAQRVEKLTVGKFFILNLPTFLGVIRNLYSWLTVFRTVAQKDK